ncbi:ATPase PAAT [Oncorhynchus kisutch]|uniref:Si:rp71-19m20.1 n=1 Tax=Oncorhynchus kisutch TaxID=8019 RepID=A0A8C7J2A3_ONCKI|nr:ATPase PAAT [Oncorhynchus kisutch]
MASIDVSTSKDGPVNGHTSWACKSQKRQLSDILLPVQSSIDTDISQIDRDTPNGCVPLLLEQVEQGSPCVITLCCAPHCPALITSLLVTSEARTIEVYSQAGDYCGTSRGERDPNTQPDSAERGPFYRKHLILESPAASCEVKLLSLGGRGSVAVARVVMGLQTLTPVDCSLSLGPSIDMLRVQSMVEEMGASLSPGAQSLMNMVQFQQKNKADSLSGFLPLLVSSGALSALARVTNGPSSAPADIQHPSVNTSLQPDEMSDSASSDPWPQSRAACDTHTSLADMMSPFLNGQPGGQRPCISPDLLPMLQSVCGQVTQLRIEDASKTSNGPRQEHACCRGLEQVLERCLGEMERRLMEHMDQRLDAMQLRLETALLQTLALPLNHLKTTAPTPDQPQALH